MDMKSAVRNATNTIIKTLSPKPEAAAETDLLDTLKKEHDEVKSLLSDLQEAGTSAQRQRLVKDIKAALVPHTKAEQKVLYDAVIALRDKEVQKLAAIKNVTSPEHKATAKVLKELVEHHIREEEGNVWRDAKDNFSADERKLMNVAYVAARARIKVP
jgi:hemerythrin-like domain-containing protein